MPHPLSQQQNEALPFAVAICKAKKVERKAPPGEGRGFGFVHNPDLSKGSVMCCLFRFTLRVDRWAAAAIIPEAYYIFHVPTSYSSLHTLVPSLWPQQIADPVPSLSSKQK